MAASTWAKASLNWGHKGGADGYTFFGGLRLPAIIPRLGYENSQITKFVGLKFRYLRLGREQFNSGFLITDNPAVQAEVEAHYEFGRFIFPLALDFSGPTVAVEDE